MPRRIERVLTSRHVFISLITTTVMLVIACGVVISLVDRKDFPSVWLGLWWAIGTVSTVGYGDVVPVTIPGRVAAVGLMVGGVVLVGLVVATISSFVVERASRGHDDVQPASRADVQRLTAALHEAQEHAQAERKAATP